MTTGVPWGASLFIPRLSPAARASHSGTSLIRPRGIEGEETGGAPALETKP
jgi:hypothetical protein